MERFKVFSRTDEPRPDFALEEFFQTPPVPALLLRLRTTAFDPPEFELHPGSEFVWMLDNPAIFSMDCLPSITIAEPTFRDQAE